MPSTNPNLASETAVADPIAGVSAPKPRKRRHRGGKKRKNRRQSFAATSETEGTVQSTTELRGPIDPLVEGQATSPPRFYRSRSGNQSDESLDSAALLDHRDQPMMRPRRDSRLNPTSAFGSSLRSPGFADKQLGRSNSGRRMTTNNVQKRGGAYRDNDNDDGNGSDDNQEADDRTPLMAGLAQHRAPTERGYGIFKTKSRGSSRSSSHKKQVQSQSQSYKSYDDYDVNNPPSVPASPDMPAQTRKDEEDEADDFERSYLHRSQSSRKNMTQSSRDALIDIDEDLGGRPGSEPRSESGVRPNELRRHQTISLPVEGDVCFPNEAMSEAGYEDFDRAQSVATAKRRSRRREWPQLWVLDEWSQQEKEQRAAAEGSRVKKISEPVLIEGRLRPQKHVWHRLDEDAPYRYTYFNDEFESTIHSQTISELVQPGGSFRELFIPDPPLLEDSSESDSDHEMEPGPAMSPRSANGGGSLLPTLREAPSFQGRISSIIGDTGRAGSRASSVRPSAETSGDQTPQKAKETKSKRYGPRPTFWLDVLSPTEQEMRILCKAFGIHALTAEDIMMQEAREKVELFRHYYFINYRTFEQDTHSEDYLEPINMYVIVFRQGVLTFHFSQSPHPANVRRRIRQLTDYLILTSDWISYAIIDDITDVYQPLIHTIEEEVDDIDELILKALQDTNELRDLAASKDYNEKQSEDEKGPSGIDMLRRIGECRKKVMSLYRLLGNKADVIKGFAKRCNEQWEVAPKSEIGLYLGDIQDHILTMTSNLSHYETLLSRAHSNYLAQISIRMNERQEQTSDVLGKLTVVGTIVLPMNIICGMWGMVSL